MAAFVDGRGLGSVFEWILVALPGARICVGVELCVGLDTLPVRAVDLPRWLWMGVAAGRLEPVEHWSSSEQSATKLASSGATGAG